MSQGKIYVGGQVSEIDTSAAKTKKTQEPEQAVDNTLSLVYPLEWGASDAFVATMLCQLADAAGELGYHIALSPISGSDEGWAERFLQSSKAKGAIILGQSVFASGLKTLHKAKLPLVVWGAPAKESRYCTIGSDNEQGGYLAARHLLELGRRNIVFIAEKGLPESKERFLGYRRAIKEFALAHNDKLVIKTGRDYNDVFESMHEGLIGPELHFDAIFAGSDHLALYVLDVCKKFGLRVPQDVGICGFDNTYAAMCASPPLSSVAHDINFGARQLVTRLVDQIQKTPVKSLQLPVTFIPRASSVLMDAHGAQQARLSLSAAGVIEFVNKAAEQLLGFHNAELFGKSLQFISPDPDLYEGGNVPDFDWSELTKAENLGKPQQIILENKEGDLVSLNITMIVHKKHEANFVAYIAIAPPKQNRKARDRSAKGNAELVDNRLQDPVTGLANEEAFRRRFDELIRTCHKEKKPLSFAILCFDDLQGFVNHSGQTAIDSGSAKVARSLSPLFGKEGAIVARFEQRFYIAVPGAAAEKFAASLGRAHGSIKSLGIRRNKGLVQMSAGSCTVTSFSSFSRREMIATAEIALFKAQQNGGNRLVHFYDGEYH